MIEEAKWLGQKIERAGSAISPMLNVGSATVRYRRTVQPWIDRYIFQMIASYGHTVTHLDVQAGEGVDLVGDLQQPDFLRHLATMRFQSLLCSNFFEHVENRQAIAETLAAMVNPKGFLFLSCPYRYPYHADPIDTGFRPSPDELAALFPSTNMQEGVILDGGTFARAMRDNPRMAVKNAVRSLVPFYRVEGWITAAAKYAWLFRHFQVTCVVLRKA